MKDEGDDHDDDEVARPVTLTDVIERLVYLEERVELLERQAVERQIDSDEQRVPKRGDDSGGRFYAVPRGRFDKEENTFVRGIYDNFDDCNLAVKGAWKNHHKGFSTRAKAVRYYEANIQRYLEEDETFYDSDGAYSPQWYVVWNKTAPEAYIVPTVEEGYRYVKGSPVYEMEKRSTYVEAQELCEEKLSRAMEDVRRRNRDADDVSQTTCDETVLSLTLPSEGAQM